jgi:hypothetical protein
MLLEIIKQWVISTISIAFHLHLIVPSGLLLLQLISHGTPSTAPMKSRADGTTTLGNKGRSQVERKEQKGYHTMPHCSADGEYSQAKCDLSNQCTKWTSSGLPLATAS